MLTFLHAGTTATVAARNIRASFPNEPSTSAAMLREPHVDCWLLGAAAACLLAVPPVILLLLLLNGTNEAPRSLPSPTPPLYRVEDHSDGAEAR